MEFDQLCTELCDFDVAREAMCHNAHMEWRDFYYMHVTSA